jgi:hypothetical protein
MYQQVNKMAFDMCLEIDSNTFLANLNDEDSERIQGMAEKILKSRGIEIDKDTEQPGFYSMNQVNEIIDEAMPNIIDFDTVIEIIKKSVATTLINEIIETTIKKVA